MPPGKEGKISTAIRLSRAEVNMLEDAQYDGLCRGVTLMSTLTFRWQDLLLQSVSGAASVANSALDFQITSPSSNALARTGSSTTGIAHDAIQKLLEKVWTLVERKMLANETINDLCRLLKIGISALLTMLKTFLVSIHVIGQIIPVWGALKNSYDSLMSVIETYGHYKSWDNLNDLSAAIGSGFPMVAMNGFITYVRNEGLRTAAKSAYSIGKTIGSIVAQVFSMGATSIVDLATAIFEAVASWAHTMFMAITFAYSTDKCNKYIESDEGMDVDQFRKVIKASPFFSAVFFGAANYIGHFNLTALLSDTSNVISTSSLMTGVASVNEVQKIACGYVADSHFEIGFRDARDREQYSWLLKMMRGYASDAPKSEFLTEDATRWQRFKHKTKKLYYKVA